VLGRGLLPPTHNLDEPDPACELDHIVERPRAEQVEHVLTNSFGFGGHNLSLVLGRAKEAFDLDKENPRVRDHYGKGLGEKLLRARRFNILFLTTALFNRFNPRCKHHQKIPNCGCSRVWLIREKAIRSRR